MLCTTGMTTAVPQTNRMDEGFSPRDTLSTAKIIEFYIPMSLRKPTKWVPAAAHGKIIECCLRKKSAWEETGTDGTSSLQ
jgi:hypothetical protein